MINQQGGLAEICTESVATWGSARKIIQAALDHYGRIDAVVNNAGILRDGIFHRMSEDDWLSVISVHLNGGFFVSRAAAEHYRAQESGTFVHITSTSGLVGNIGQANYAAAKLGITALSKSIALDMVGGSYANRNVRSLAMDGRLVLIAFLGGTKVENFDLTLVMVRRLTITGSTMRPRTTAQKGQIAVELKEKVWPVLDAGRCGPVIHATFRLDQVVEAHKLMESSQHIGKIMLTVG